MPKKNKTKNKTTKNKNKNLLNVKININSNNKKKAVVQQQNKKAIQPSSSPIVISHAPQPYLQPQQHIPNNLTDNNYGIGITNKLNALDGGLTRIYEENAGIRESQRLAELANRTFLSKFDELQAEIKARAEEPPRSVTSVSEGEQLRSVTSVPEGAQLRSVTSVPEGAPVPENVPSSASSIKSAQNPLFDEKSDNSLMRIINASQKKFKENDDPEKESSLLLSTNLFGNSDKNIIDEENKSVKSLINYFEKEENEKEDKRRSTRNRKEADQSDTPELRHQKPLNKLSAAYRRYNKNLNDPRFQKIVNKLLADNKLNEMEYYDWTMKKDPEWVDFLKGTEFY